MRTQKLARTPSQSLCVFCACRLGVEPVALRQSRLPPGDQRRGLKNTRNAAQSTEPATQAGTQGEQSFALSGQAAWKRLRDTSEARPAAKFSPPRSQQQAQLAGVEPEQHEDLRGAREAAVFSKGRSKPDTARRVVPAVTRPRSAYNNVSRSRPLVRRMDFMKNNVPGQRASEGNIPQGSLRIRGNDSTPGSRAKQQAAADQPRAFPMWLRKEETVEPPAPAASGWGSRSELASRDQFIAEGLENDATQDVDPQLLTDPDTAGGEIDAAPTPGAPANVGAEQITEGVSEDSLGTLAQSNQEDHSVIPLASTSSVGAEHAVRPEHTLHPSLPGKDEQLQDASPPLRDASKETTFPSDVPVDLSPIPATSSAKKNRMNWKSLDVQNDDYGGSQNPSSLESATPSQPTSALEQSDDSTLAAAPNDLSDEATQAASPPSQPLPASNPGAFSEDAFSDEDERMFQAMLARRAKAKMGGRASSSLPSQLETQQEPQRQAQPTSSPEPRSEAQLQQQSVSQQRRSRESPVDPLRGTPISATLASQAEAYEKHTLDSKSKGVEAEQSSRSNVRQEDARNASPRDSSYVTTLAAQAEQYERSTLAAQAEQYEKSILASRAKAAQEVRKPAFNTSQDALWAGAVKSRDNTEVDQRQRNEFAAQARKGEEEMNLLHQRANSADETFLDESDLRERAALMDRAKALQEEKRQREDALAPRPKAGYKLKMAEDAATGPTYKSLDPSLVSQWQIFKDQRPVEPAAEPEQRRADPRPVSGIRSMEDIDAKFEEHRRQRAAVNQPIDLSTIAYKPALERHQPRQIEREKQVCVRCGQAGHSARDCTTRANAGRQGPPNLSIRRVSGNAAYEDETTPGQNIGFKSSRSRDRVASAEQSSDVFSPALSREVDEEPTGRVFTPRKFLPDVNDADEGPTERVFKSRKFLPDAAEDDDRSSSRRVRRSRSNEDDEDERPRRGRAQRVDDEGLEDDDRPRGRRDQFEDAESLEEGDFESLREAREQRKKARQAKKDKKNKEADKKAAQQTRRSSGATPIQLPEFVSVSRLAQTLGVRYDDFVVKMERLGFTNTSHDHVLSAENAGLIAMEYNFDSSFGDSLGAEEEERDLKPQPEVEDKEYLPTRPPVVAIMGHVDHGKTTILDYLRSSSVAATEHGGITQHIGAFSVPLASGRTITFLDTPGHAAFLAMRQRGATVTDIVILVVAADDSVKPQTLEALKHARDANVPIIVAINKIDKEEANVERVKQDLARHGVEIEDFGGDTQVVCVSGKTGEGMDELEEAAVTLSEILDHRADTSGPVEGWVLEATTKRAGRVATVLVRRGTLTVGNIVVAGKTWARVRSLNNEAGQSIMSAGPGTPVEIDGWRDQPVAGDEVLQATSEQKATDVVAYRAELGERLKMAEDMEAINEVRRAEQEKRIRDKASEAAGANGVDDATVADAGKEGADTGASDAPLAHQSIPFIVKADVSGSVEAVNAYLLQMSNPLCSPTLLRSGVGPVSEFDIEHAYAAGGHIVSFNLPSDPNTVADAERRGVKVLEQNVIYRIVGDVKAVLESKLPEMRTQRVVGEADVAVSFEIGVGGRKKVRIAGCKVRNGMVGRGSRVRVLRDGVKIYDGVLSSLKNVKKDVAEMRKGTECGLGFEDWEAFEVGDQVQTYEEKVEKRTLQI